MMTGQMTSEEVDDMIENEVCNRLIRMSCAKMVHSKNERGGAKLHRNLLILHLLRRARNEQKRPATPSPEASSSYSYLTRTQAEVVIESSSNNDDSDDDHTDVGHYDRNADRLLDLSSSSRSENSINTMSDPLELSVRDDDDVDYCSLRLEPLQLPFGTDCAAEAHELTDLSNPSLPVVPELSAHLPLITNDLPQSTPQHSLHQLTASPLPPVQTVQPVSTLLSVTHSQQPPNVSESLDSDVNEHPPVLFTSGEAEQEHEQDPVSSSDEEDGEESDTEEDFETAGQSSLSTTSTLVSRRRRRKRRTSSPRANAPCTTAKKCCVEERQLTGLISVFNSGLSVVADHLAAHSSHSHHHENRELLQQPHDRMVPSLMRIACNPLICQ